MAKGGRGRGRSGGGQQRGGGGTATMVRGAGPGTRAPGNMAAAARSGGAEVQPWGLADAMNAIAARAGMSNPMPRSALDQVPFGPNWALPPQPLDPARPDTGRPEPRVFEYPVAFNIPGNGNRPIPWDTLYAASTNVDIIRRCIEIRKRHLRGMEWGWGVTEEAIAEALLGDPAAGRMDVETKLREQYLPEIRRATEFWRKPWKANGLSFGQWLNGWLDQHLVLDGVAVYPRATYGGDVTDLEIIDASTIKLLLDNRGARPEHPFPAFQQELYGFPRGEFTVSVAPDGMMHGGYAADQLYYHRENFRPQTPYGFSAVEQSLISARLYLKRQGWMLAEYDDGSTPLMWLVPAATAEMWSQMSADQRRRWEQSLNDEMAGNQGGRHRVKVTPPGFQPIAMPSVDERYKPEYDMFLIKMAAGFFNVTVAELGLTEPKGLGSSGYHEGQEAVEGRVGQRPDTVMVAESINDLSYDFLRIPREIEFKFIDPQADDEKTKAEVAGMRRARATITLNDERREIGMAPLPFKEADMPFLISGDKATPLEGLAEVLKLAQQAQQASLEASNAQMEADSDATDLEAEELESESAEKALEMASYRRWARKRGGRAGRMFICKALDPADWPGSAVPADVDFEHWEWVPDDPEILKGLGNDNWRSLARDHRGRWMPRGRMRVDPLGPATPGKEVLSGLRRDAARRRSVSTDSQLSSVDTPTTMQGMTTPKPERKPKLTAEQRKRQNFTDELVRLTMLNPNNKRTEEQVRADAAGMGVDRIGEDIGFMREHLRSRGIDHQTDAQRARQVAPAPEAKRVFGDIEQPSAARVDAQARYDSAESVRGGDEGQRMAAAQRRDNAADGIDAPAARAGFGRRDGKTPEQAAEQRAERHRADIASAYGDLVGRTDAASDWVGLAAIRERVAHLSREEQDAALRQLNRTPGVHIHPLANLKSLTPADRAAAMEIGDEQVHAIRIDARGREALGLAQPAPKRADVSAVGGAAGPVNTGPLIGDDDLMDAIEDIGRGGNGYASLEAVRARMGGTREEQDAALKRMDRARLIALDPDPLRATMTQQRRDAALRVGPEDKHVVRLMASRVPATPGRRAGRRAAKRNTSADDPELTTVREGQPTPGFAIPAADSAVPARQISLPESAGLSPEQRERFAAVGAESAAHHAVIFGKDRAELERLIRDERTFGALAGSEAERRASAARLTEAERYLSMPRGDAAIQATKTARELVELGDAKGMVVLVQHRSSSGTLAPYFTVQILDPKTSSGINATFHSFKSTGDAYKLHSATTIKDGRSTSVSSGKALREHLEGIGAPKLNAEVEAERHAASRTVNPAQRIRTQDVQEGDWRYHPTEGWQKIGMIEAPGVVRQRVIWGEDRETKLGTLGGDANNWIARTPDKPTLPPGPEMVRALQRKPGEAVKRGDILIAERKDTTYYGGNTGISNPRIVYHVFEVTSVTRDGKPREVRNVVRDSDLKPRPVKDALHHRLYTGKASVLPGDAIDREGLTHDLRQNTFPGSTTPRDVESLGQLGEILAGRVRPGSR